MILTLKHTHIHAHVNPKLKPSEWCSLHHLSFIMWITHGEAKQLAPGSILSHLGTRTNEQTLELPCVTLAPHFDDFGQIHPVG